MAQTTIEDTEGNLLWEPDSLEGVYSVQKAEEVTEILKSLLKDITIKMEGTINGESMADIYTKEQADDRFVQNSNFDATLDAKVRALTNSGDLVGVADKNYIMERLRALWSTCYGTNFENVVVNANSYNTRLDNLDIQYSAMVNNLDRVMRDMYQENRDGTLNTKVLLLATVAAMGELSDLKSGITDRGSVIDAINFVFTKINTDNSLLGSDQTLSTTAKTLVGAVNELLGMINNSNASQSQISQSIADLATQIAAIAQKISQNEVDITKESARTDKLEAMVGSVNQADLKTTSKTVVGAINEINTIQNDRSTEVSSLSTEVANLKSTVSGMSPIVETVGSVKGIDSSLYGDPIYDERGDEILKTYTDVLNTVASILKSVDEKLQDIETRLSNLE